MRKVGVLPILTEAMASNDIAVRHLARDCMKNLSMVTNWEEETSNESNSDSDSEDDGFGESPENISDVSSDGYSNESEDSDEFFFGDIKSKSNIESLRKEKESLDLEIESYRNKIKEEREEGKKLKTNLQGLKKQLEKRFRFL